MAVAGTGEFNLVLENLRTLIANCSTFQTWTGTANAAAAKARVHLYAEDDASVTRPAVILAFADDDEWGAEKIIGGDGNLYMAAGSARVRFTASIEDTYSTYSDDHANLMLAFMNDVGGIVRSMMGLANTDDGTNVYIDMTKMSKTVGPWRPGKESDVDYLGVQFVADWEGKAGS